MSQIVDLKMLLENCIILPNSGWMKIPSLLLKSICLFFTPLMTNYGKKESFTLVCINKIITMQENKNKKEFLAFLLYFCMCVGIDFFRICQPCSMLFFRAKLNFLLFLLLFIQVSTKALLLLTYLLLHVCTNDILTLP